MPGTDHQVESARLALQVNSDSGEGEEGVIDLLTNLRRYCHEEGIDFEAALQSSEIHSEAEVLA